MTLCLRMYFCLSCPRYARLIVQSQWAKKQVNVFVSGEKMLSKESEWRVLWELFETSFRFFTIDVQVTTLQGSKCIFRHSFCFAVWVHTKPHFYQGTMTSGRWSGTEFVARLSDRKARTVAPSGHFHVISFLTLHTLVTRSLGVRSPRRLCRSTNAHQSSALRKVNVLGWQAPFCSRLTQWPPLTCPGVTHPGPPSWALTWRGPHLSATHTHTHTHLPHACSLAAWVALVVFIVIVTVVVVGYVFI